MKRLLLLLAFLGLGHFTMLSCTCVPIPTFCETITYSGNVDSSYLIVHGRVEEIGSQSMRVRIIDVLFGTAHESIITIRSGNGADCLVMVSRFQTHAEYLFAFLGGGENTYHLLECGVTFLEITGYEIRGSIAPGINSIRIADFPNLQDCGGIGSSLFSIDVSPTLTSHDIVISSTQDIPDVAISVFDMIGRRVYVPAQRELLATAPVVIPGTHFPAGCYTIVVDAQGFRRAFRVVIV